MKFFIVIALFAVAAASNEYRAAPAPYRPAPAPYKPAANEYKSASYEEYQPTGPYTFGYDVKDSESYNDFEHSESSDGKVTTGSYRVALPDGRIQIVTYRADSYGNVAEVKYEGEARYPDEAEYKTAAYAAPAYKAPAYSAPAYKAPAYKAPAYSAPSY